MTQIHPNILGALAALGDLADQHQWLGDLLEPGTAVRHAPRLSPAGRAQLDRQTRAEKRDQVESARQGLAPRGQSKAPVVLSVLNAQLQALEAVMDAAWRCTSALHTCPDAPPPYRGGGADDLGRFAAATTYLQTALVLVHPELAGELGRDLNAEAKRCEAVTGSAPTRTDLHVSCPACGRRSLQAHTTTVFEHALITCTRSDCRCRGVDCMCRRPARTPGLRHIWGSDDFDQLKRLFDKQEAA